MENQLTLFDYNKLDLDTRSSILSEAKRANFLLRAYLTFSIEFGEILLDIKKEFDSHDDCILFSTQGFEEKEAELVHKLKFLASSIILISGLANRIFKKIGFDNYMLLVAAKNGFNSSANFWKQALQIYEYCRDFEVRNPESLSQKEAGAIADLLSVDEDIFSEVLKGIEDGCHDSKKA